jgi:cytochrome P450
MQAQRKSLMPSFSYRHIKDLYPIFWSKAIEMTDEIEKTLPAKNHTIQVGNWASRAMLDIIGLAGMDYDLNSVQDPNNELSRHYSKLLTPPTGIQRLVAILCLFVVGFKWYFRVPTAYTRTVRASVQYIRNVTKEIIREKQGKLERKEDIGVDILSVAMRSGNFSDENLVDQVMTFLAAGHETTSSAFQLAVYALSKHPEMQTLLREEVSKNMPASLLQRNKKEPIPAAVIDKNFPYLTAFLSEVLRFYPSVPFTAREAAHDTTLAGQHIPKGTNILIAPEITNKDEDLWGADAHVFNPERWLSGDNQDADDVAARRSAGGASSNYAYSTFIHGPRSCIGQGFARAELAIFVAVWVSRFEVALKDPEKKLDVRQMITQAPADGVVVRVKVLDP